MQNNNQINRFGICVNTIEKSESKSDAVMIISSSFGALTNAILPFVASGEIFDNSKLVGSNLRLVVKGTSSL